MRLTIESGDQYLGHQVCGGFTIDRIAGLGSFAWVFHASRGNQEVAIKVLHSTDSTAQVRFAREIEVLRALPPNPHVVRFLESGYTDDGRPLIVLEFINGITLKEGLERVPKLEPQKAAAVLAELCEGFVGLHSLGVAHRDVKPENILFDHEGRVKLIDFGLIRDAQGILKLLEQEDVLPQRIFSEELDRNIFVGTAEYMAPEQITDAQVNDLSLCLTDTWSDVFSLGVIGHQMLTGEKPFPMRSVTREEYPREFLKYIRQRMAMTDSDIPPRPNIDPALDSILHKALRHDPRQRQYNAHALLENLSTYLATGEGVSLDEGRKTLICEAPISSLTSKFPELSEYEDTLKTDQPPANLEAEQSATLITSATNLYPHESIEDDEQEEEAERHSMIFYADALFRVEEELRLREHIEKEKTASKRKP